MSAFGPHQVLKASEVAPLFRVSAKTVVRWGHEGLIPMFVTPSGHTRFKAADVLRILQGGQTNAGDDAR